MGAASDSMSQQRSKLLASSVALLVVLISFVVQTENAAYIQKELGWNKPYLLLYMTHGSWILLLPLQVLYLLPKSSLSFSELFKSHITDMLDIAYSIAGK